MYIIVITILLAIVAFAGYSVFNSFAPSFTSLGTEIESAIDENDSDIKKEAGIRVSEPRMNQEIGSPLIIKGEAVGTWYMEGSFPIVLYDGNATEIARTNSIAQSAWTTENYVPFSGLLYFTKPSTTIGKLRLYKDNPSGLPAQEAFLEIPIRFE